MNRFLSLATLIPILCAALSSLPSRVNAQSSTSLDELNEQYRNEVNAAERDIKEKYVAALLRMQQRLQSMAKLEDALAVKRERERIEAEIAAAGESGGTTNPSGTPTDPSGATEFVFKSGNANSVGEVKFTEKWDALTGWRGEGSGAEWDLSAVPAGVYSVTIEFASPVEGGTLKAQQGSAEFDFSVTGTGGWVTYDTAEAGQINLENPSTPLRILVVDDGGSPFGMINLRSVTLKKIGAGN